MSIKMRDSVTRKMLPMRHSSNSRRSMLLYGFLGILCLVRTIESRPLTETSSSSSSDESRGTLQSKKGQEEEVGNPSEIAYQAWLLIDGHPDSQPLGGLDSASLLRRIKPKSIFVAPNLTACPEGYQDDTMNRCVKDVNIDHQAHKGFLVQRLQAIFGHKLHGAASSSSSSSSSSSASVPSGPLQLNIPLIMAAPVKPPPGEKINFQPSPEEATTSTTEAPKMILEDGKATNVDEVENNEKHEAIVTVYELNEDESTFFLGNKTSGNTVENDKSDPTILVPVEDGHGNLPVNDKLTDDIETSHNLTILVGGSINKDNEGTYEDTPSRVKEETNEKKRNIPPTVVLVLSPTKGPSIPVDNSQGLIVAHNSSLGQVIIKMENVSTSNATKEIIEVSVPDAIRDSSSSGAADVNPHSAEVPTPDSKVAIAADTTSNEEESTELSETYDEENYDEDSSETEDEILKHSEAGITVTLPATGGGQTVTDNSTTAYSDKELAAGSSEISGEVSINRDFVRETTLVDFNVSKTVDSTTIPPSRIVENPESSDPDAEEIVLPLPPPTPSDDTANDDISIAQVKKLSSNDMSRRNETEIRQTVVFPTARPIEQTIRYAEQPTWTEKTDSTETMVASSTNDAHQTVVSREEPKFDMPSYSSSKKRAGQPFTFEATTKIPHKPFSTIPNVESVYDYYPARNPYDPPEEDGVVPVIRTIDDQRYPAASDTHKQQFENFFPTQHRDYVNFDRRTHPNYVSFPSEEANSIHPNDYKERRPYNRYQQQLHYGRGSPVTKNPSTQEINQKQSYWWLPPGWPLDKQQQQQDVQHRSGNDRSRTPMLLRFWTRMPLVRDPSLNYQHPTYPGERTSASARRVNYYKEMSTQDFNRAFVRKTLPSAIGG